MSQDGTTEGYLPKADNVADDALGAIREVEKRWLSTLIMISSFPNIH